MKKNIFIIFLFALTACLPTIKNFDEYQKAPLLDADIMPSKEAFSGKLPKIVVSPLNNNQIKLAEEKNLGNAIAVYIENIITKDKIVELVDRQTSEKMVKEVALAEMSGTASYTGPKIANYIITGNISNADFSSRYIAAKHEVDIINQTYRYISPEWSYLASISGNIKIYELPSMTVIGTLSFSGTATSSENAERKATAKTYDDYLMKVAMERALSDTRVNLKNSMAGKGYVLEKRVFKDKTIFKISMGTDMGLKHGDKIKFYTKTEEVNDITGTSDLIEEKITDGVVSNILNKKYSWIIVKENQEKVRLGDIAQLYYK